MRLIFSRRAGIWLFLAVAVALGIAALLFPQMDLPLSYHHFADQRGWLGIPNFGNVASNVAYLAAGLWGLSFLARKSNRERFVDPLESWPYVFLFFGLLLTQWRAQARHFRAG
jgi:hypothetical protein